MTKGFVCFSYEAFHVLKNSQNSMRLTAWKLFTFIFTPFVYSRLFAAFNPTILGNASRFSTVWNFTSRRRKANTTFSLFQYSWVFSASCCFQRVSGGGKKWASKHSTNFWCWIFYETSNSLLCCSVSERHNVIVCHVLWCLYVVENFSLIKFRPRSLPSRLQFPAVRKTRWKAFKAFHMIHEAIWREKA